MSVFTTCRTCGSTIPSARRGRPRAYCSAACKQRAYRKRVDPGIGSPERHERKLMAREDHFTSRALHRAGIMDGPNPLDDWREDNQPAWLKAGRKGVIHGENESKPPSTGEDSSASVFMTAVVRKHLPKPLSWVESVRAAAKAASAASAGYARSVLRDVGVLPPSNPDRLVGMLDKAESEFRNATRNGEVEAPQESAMTQTIPERVESLEERQTRLEETFRSYLDGIAQTAQRISDRVPEDARISEAVERLTQGA